MTPQIALEGAVNIPVHFLQDDTGSNSVTQASVQFRNLQNKLPSSSLVDFGGVEGSYWLELNLTNQARDTNWHLELPPASQNMPCPIKSAALYDPEKPDEPIAVWPGMKKIASSQMSLPVILPFNQSVTRYVLIETWPGIKNPVFPILKTQRFLDEETTDNAKKTGTFWLIMGAIFGAGLVQLILTRQPVQGVLAINALLLAGAVLLLGNPEIIPGIISSHALLLPLGLSCFIGIAASLLLWVASRPYTTRAMLCVFPIILNAAILLLSLLKLDVILDANVSIEKLPLILMSVTGIILLLITFATGIVENGLMWFAPAWLSLMLLPWLANGYPLLSPIFYAIMLCLGGISSVFSYWRTMDRETEALQKRLRTELKSNKHKYEEDKVNWERKIEHERALMNELRYREQQRSAELEIARKEADAANRAKSDFLAIISHEIRTPMSGIIGIVNLMRQTALNNEQHEYVDVIKNSGDTMLTLLNDILDYSKIEKGVIELENIGFTLRTLVKSVATLMTGRAQEKNIHIIVDIPETVPDYYSGDPNRIRQILLNLVGNALKFTKTGSVTIRVSAHETGDSLPVRFEIIDTGIGISAEAQTRLFQPYAQADASISRRFGGTGLGLNICQMLVTAMHGEIGIQSTEGQGSNFWFVLPLHVEKSAPQMTPHGDNDAAKTAKPFSILLIDDNAINLKITSGLLKADGHKVIACDSGKKALELLETENFDVIFVDMLMPDMDGRTFVTLLHQNPDKNIADLPVFALTGLADEVTRQKAAELNMKDVLVKPVSKDVLRAALQQISEMPLVDSLLSRLHALSEEDQNKLLQALKNTSPNDGTIGQA